MRMGCLNAEMELSVRVIECRAGGSLALRRRSGTSGDRISAGGPSLLSA